jgi:hypothetical protein
MSRTRKIVALPLGCVIVCLLIVGVVSSPPTRIRHIVQVIPIVLVLIMVLRGMTSWAFAAMPIFLFWLVIMILIWLYLLSLAKIVSGTFSPAEIILTIIIGLASVTGLVAAARSITRSGLLRGAAVFVVLAGLQFGAIWLSMQEAFRQG